MKSSHIKSDKKRLHKVSIYQNLSNEKEYKASTGLTSSEFNKLFEVFEKLYYPKTGSGLDNLYTPLFTDKREALFFVLYHLKTNVSYQVLALNFGISEGSAYTYTKSLKCVLKESLVSCEAQPVRVFESQESFDAFFTDLDVDIDVTEIRTERPIDDTLQKENYSGKKKDHTRKWLIVSSKEKEVLFLGKISAGKTHDFTMFKNDFKEKNLSKLKSIWIDLGFQGMDKQFVHNNNIHIPKKSSKNIPLTTEDKESNRIISRNRIGVENTIGGIKRYFILRNESRARSNEIMDENMNICCGLWNFKVRLKKEINSLKE